jgi:hypothetical protein
MDLTFLQLVLRKENNAPSAIPFAEVTPEDKTIGIGSK